MVCGAQAPYLPDHKGKTCGTCDMGEVVDIAADSFGLEERNVLATHE